MTKKGGPEREREKAREGDRNRDEHGSRGGRKRREKRGVPQGVSSHDRVSVSVSVCRFGLDPRKNKINETMPKMFEL